MGKGGKGQKGAVDVVDYKIGVCIPSTGVWVDRFGKSLATMFAYLASVPLPNARSQKVDLITSSGSMLSAMRQTMVGTALRNGCTHILFLDSDMTFPPNLVHRLVAMGKDIAAANCVTRVPPIKWLAHGIDGEVLDSSDRIGLEEVRQVGCAVMLIRAEVVKAMQPPLFLQDWVPGLNAFCGEDVFFCMKAMDSGFKTYVDHDLSKEIGHVGVVEFNHSYKDTVWPAKKG